MTLRCAHHLPSVQLDFHHNENPRITAYQVLDLYQVHVSLARRRLILTRQYLKATIPGEVLFSAGRAWCTWCKPTINKAHAALRTICSFFAHVVTCRIKKNDLIFFMVSSLVSIYVCPTTSAAAELESRIRPTKQAHFGRHISIVHQVRRERITTTSCVFR